MHWLIILVIVFILGIKLGSTLVCSDLVLNKRITLEEYNLYKSFKKLWELFKKIINKYFYFHIENPLKTYWKVRKYFKFPKLIFQFYKSLSNDAKIISIKSYDIFWKDKWDSPSQEHNPIFVITLFNKFHFQIDFTYYYNNSDYSLEYWESILWFVYYDKTLNQAVYEGASWKRYNPETDKYEIVEIQVLKDKYHKLYKKEYL